MTKSAENCEFGQIYWRNTLWKTLLCSVTEGISAITIMEFTTLTSWMEEQLSLSYLLIGIFDISCADLKGLKVRNSNGSAIKEVRSFDPPMITNTRRKMKCFMKFFFSKCDQIRRKLRIWSHLMKKSSMENFIFWAMWNLWFFVNLKCFFALFTLHPPSSDISSVYLKFSSIRNSRS